jgi:hypothetical protein
MDERTGWREPIALDRRHAGVVSRTMLLDRGRDALRGLTREGLDFADLPRPPRSTLGTEAAGGRGRTCSTRRDGHRDADPATFLCPQSTTATKASLRRYPISRIVLLSSVD